MLIPTFDRMRQLMAPVWQVEEYQRDILWAGVFGSVSRNRAKVTSDVDILIVLKDGCTGEPVDLHEKLAEVCGREISLMCIWQGHDWAWGNVRVEALISSRTIYGTRSDVEHLHSDAMTFLYDGLKMLDLVAEALGKIRNLVATVQIYEKFVHPTQWPARQECIQELRKVIEALDIQPHYHPIRTMLNPCALRRAASIRAQLDGMEPDVTTGTMAIWKILWDKLQFTSVVMETFVSACMGGQKYIRHMLASKRLADRFEEGGQVDDSMYSEIVR